MCTFKCACGATFKALSNKEEENLEVCSECHPFYTGTQGNRKKTGNVEKFNKTFADLYAKYQDETVQQFIKGMGWALSSAINKKNGVIK